MKMKKNVWDNDTIRQIIEKNATFYYVDIDRYTNYAKKWGVDAVPVVLVVKDGKEVGRLNDEATATEVKDFFQKNFLPPKPTTLELVANQKFL